MLQILGSANPFRQGVGRRTAMRVGALGAAALSLPELMYHAAQAADRTPQGLTFGKAKRILLVYLQGAASQFETWDPKPDAPEGIRGHWGAAQTSVPGVFICDQLPKLAALADRFGIVRSMTHPNNNHSNLYTLTGYAATDFSSETNPFDNRHHPFFGSVLDYLEQQKAPDVTPELPRNIGLPFQFSRYAPFSRRSGPYGAFLGQGYNPVWTEFDGKATKTVNRVSFFRRLAGVDVQDPFLGITPESRLRLSKAAQLPRDLTLDRLDKRRSLLQQFDQEQRRVGQSSPVRSLDRFQEMAFSLITSSRIRDALDVGKEPMSVREKYGMNLFGQSALSARRLLEAGCPLVCVFWDEYKVVNTAWDTHFNHFTRMGNELLPGLDSGLSSLLTDLEDRGLLDETLVMCLTEHGRPPKIDQPTRGGGRGHWSQAYSVMLAGGGIRPGTVVGASDAEGAFVKERPVSPEDILATMYYLKGIPGNTTIPDRLGRPVQLTQHGQPIRELI